VEIWLRWIRTGAEVRAAAAAEAELANEGRAEGRLGHGLLPLEENEDTASRDWTCDCTILGSRPEASSDAEQFVITTRM
jgi:hypothetical protein